jgi:hypothetical protein
MKTYGDGTYGTGTYGEPSISLATNGESYAYAVGPAITASGALWFAHRYVGTTPDDDQVIVQTPNLLAVIDDDLVASLTLRLAFDQAVTASAQIPDDGLWHHVAFSWELTASGYAVTAFVDGVEVATAVEPVEEMAPGDGVIYALNGTVPDGCPGHRVYDLALWSVATDAADVAAGMLALVGDEAGLAHLWRGDDETGAEAINAVIGGPALVEAADSLWAGRVTTATGDLGVAASSPAAVVGVAENPALVDPPAVVAAAICSVTVYIIRMEES